MQSMNISTDKCLTTIESLRVSRVGGKPMAPETRRVRMLRTVIWSDLHGNVQQRWIRWGSALRRFLNTLSVDTFLGLPFNIASYALLLEMVAQVTNQRADELIMSLGNLHLYKNHVDQAVKQLGREPKPLPLLRLNKKRSLDHYTAQDILIEGYDPHPAIQAPISV